MSEEVTVQYVGGHAEVYNALSGAWKSGEKKVLPAEVAKELLTSGSAFKLVESDD